MLPCTLHPGLRRRKQRSQDWMLQVVLEPRQSQRRCGLDAVVVLGPCGMPCMEAALLRAGQLQTVSDQGCCRCDDINASIYPVGPGVGAAHTPGMHLNTGPPH